MKILIAPDKFKGTLSAKQVCNIVGKAIAAISPDTEIIELPLADGGEGTIDALREDGDTSVTVDVCGPSFTPVEAEYIIKGDAAVIEMAESSGLMKVPAAARNPEETTSYGFGQLIWDAYHNHNIRKFMLGIGGSATNDCGIGMLAALGVRFLDKNGFDVVPVGSSLGKITDIRFEDRFDGLAQCYFTVMNDVRNPLLGDNGAARVYAPQKGADPSMLERLERGARSFADVIERHSGRYVGDIAGGGAAGGVGMALEHFLGASMKGGAACILELTNAAEKIDCCDTVITGEGAVDAQTLHGKLVSEVISLAKSAHKPCYVVCGIVKDGVDTRRLGVDGLFSIAGSGISQKEAVSNAGELLYSLVVSEFVKIIR